MFRKIIFTIVLFLIITAIVIPFVNGQAVKYEPKGKRDPFVPLIGSGKSASVGLEDVLSVEDLNLEGIAVGPQGKMVAIINDHILKENDKVGNLQVKSITKKEAVIFIEGKEYKLGLIEEGGAKSEK